MTAFLRVPTVRVYKDFVGLELLGLVLEGKLLGMELEGTELVGTKLLGLALEGSELDGREVAIVFTLLYESCPTLFHTHQLQILV